MKSPDVQSKDSRNNAPPLTSPTSVQIYSTASEIILAVDDPSEAEKKIRLLERIAKIQAEQEKQYLQLRHENFKLYARLIAGAALLVAGLSSLFIQSMHPFSLILIASGACSLIPGIDKVFISVTRLAMSFAKFAEQEFQEGRDKK